MKVALALESQHPRPHARARAVARALVGDELIVAACLADATADGAAVAARLGIRAAFLVADAAIAKTGSRGRAQALAQLLTGLAVDLVLVDAADDGGGGLFSASLAHHGRRHGLFAVNDVTAADDPSAVVAVIEIAGMRHRLRVDLPAVISLGGDADAAAPIDRDAVASHRFSLADLGLQPDQLLADPIPGTSFVPTYQRSKTPAGRARFR